MTKKLHIWQFLVIKNVQPLNALILAEQNDIYHGREQSGLMRIPSAALKHLGLTCWGK